ncbi:type VII toxin-antitoxin system MntA family adenylyltransferase antitoxin [Dehalobacterium formicoaceticum]|uniref:Nucleotidyltransferase domain-containing protein n=1 Tax=Dehalobacterium formicoaceticum TaxID=51515 RepID=A0ABT1Y6S0_9FIRM|nr:nucleotidyltransferase domain-containing protein [Dehalobacterium formicoaceticum]MCR6546585.1 nucleotidyltransferase domain-containing protein [Dehalobacterium formicoaceticum]
MKNYLSKVELLKKLEDFIEKVKGNKLILAVFLFGSYAAGRQTLLSDVDIAVLFCKTIKPKQIFTERLRLMGELSIVLGRDDIDLVVLNEAPPSLGYRVIKDGQLLYIRDGARSQLIDYQVMTMDRYFDYLPTQKIFSDGLARRMKEGRFGG